MKKTKNLSKHIQHKQTNLKIDRPKPKKKQKNTRESQKRKKQQQI